MLVLSPRLQGLLLRITLLRLENDRDDDERGASAVEYGLMVAGIAAVIVGAVFLLGQGVLNNLFTDTCNSINQNMGGNC
jgi:pilus assembly protein Flp/PilA